MAKRTLLVADDDEMNRIIIGKFLSSDYDVIEAANGLETLEILHDRPIDALLLDIIMPEMDGLDVLARMQEEPAMKRVGVLVATSTKERTERKALSLGADDVVAKPYDPIVITARLRNILAVKDLEARSMGEGAQVADRERAEQVHKAADRIRRTVNVVKKNVSNHQLVLECSADLLETVDALDSLYQ